MPYEGVFCGCVRRAVSSSCMTSPQWFGLDGAVVGPRAEGSKV